MSPNRLSVLLIAKNEERDLPSCLDSLKGLADEIVLVDGHSTDRTRTIAEAAGARVFQKEWEGYGLQKQFALDQSTGDWVLNIDADERLTPGLREEILRVLTSSPDEEVVAYSIPFRLFVLGRRLRFGRGARETHVRLFRRDRASYPRRIVHEGISVDGPVGKLRGAVDHHSYRDFSEYLKKMDEYTALLSAAKRSAGGRFSFWMHLRLPWEFFLRYVLKGGMFDGNAGFVHAALSAVYAWLKLARLLEAPSGTSDDSGGTP